MHLVNQNLVKLLTVCLLLLYTNCLIAQESSIKFRLVDDKTLLPLAFATVIINYPSEKQITTDIDGVFKLNQATELKNIRFSYVGYETKDVNGPFTNNQTFRLSRIAINLKEVIISPDYVEKSIISKVINNRKMNNYLNNDFEAELYCKSGMQILDTSFVIMDKLKYLFMFDNVNFLRNSSKSGLKEEVLKSEAPGFSMPILSLLVSEIQPMSFYQDQILLIDSYFTNPLSKKGLNEYSFVLESTEIQAQDTFYRISFVPKKGFDKTGLIGRVQIQAPAYAIENITAEPKTKTNFYLKIAHEYDKSNSWFPTVFNAQVYYPQINPQTPAFRLSTITYFKKIGKNEENLPPQTISNYRSIFYDSDEKESYQIIDSLLKNSSLPKIFNIGSKLLTGKWPTKFFDINIDRIFSYNLFEKARLGFGFTTNDFLSQKLKLSSYFGYGFGDKASKYGVKLAINLTKKTEINANYENTIAEVGTSMINKPASMLENRSFIASRFDHKEIYELGLKSGKNGLTWLLNLRHENVNPLYEYAFGNLSNTQNFLNSQITFGFRYQHNQNSILLLNNRINTTDGNPDFTFDITKGIKGIFNSEFDFLKVAANIHQQFYTQNVGTTSYSLQTGFLNRPLPYGLLFEGRGSFDRSMPIIMNNFFQTLRPYEFMHDRFAFLFFKHTFDHWFDNSKFSPLISVHLNSGIGQLNSKIDHLIIPIQVMNKPYFESGLEVNRLLKFNYLNVMYAGVGFGVFSRIGEYAYPQFNDNLFFKITASFHTR